MAGTATATTICGSRVQLGDYVEVRYTTGTRSIGGVLRGRITELWDPEVDGHHQARIDGGWCFHDHDEILKHEPGPPPGGRDVSDEGKYGEPWWMDDLGYLRTKSGHLFDRRLTVRSMEAGNACAHIPDPAALVEAARRALRVLESDEDIDDSAADAVTVRQVLAKDLRTALNPEEFHDGD